MRKCNFSPLGDYYENENSSHSSRVFITQVLGLKPFRIIRNIFVHIIIEVNLWFFQKSQRTCLRSHGQLVSGEIPGGLVVRIWHFYCEGTGLIPGQGTIPQAMWHETQLVSGRPKTIAQVSQTTILACTVHPPSHHIIHRHFDICSPGPKSYDFTQDHGSICYKVVLL